MIPYRMDYTIEKVLENRNAPEQQVLQQLTGKIFATNEATMLLKKIKDHKWNVSEQLGRDVGIKVAAIDYFENIYKLPTTPKTNNLMT